MLFDATWTAVLMLVAAVFAYGHANLAQAVAAHREETPAWSEFGLIARLLTRPLYLAGSGGQILGFLFAFAARRELPLYLVQATTAGAVGVTALLGTLLLGWRIRRGELVALAGLGVGLAVLAGAAAPSAPHDLGDAWIAAIGGLLPLWALLAGLSATVPGAKGGILLGGVAGLCLGTGAMCARTVADAGSLWSMLTHPALYVMVAHLLLGQAVMAPALARRATTPTIATMQATSLASAALAGLVLLGDKALPGREPLVPLGLLLVLTAVVALTSIVQWHQHEPDELPSSDPRPVVLPAGVAVGSGRPVSVSVRVNGKERPAVRRRPAARSVRHCVAPVVGKPGGTAPRSTASPAS